MKRFTVLTLLVLLTGWTATADNFDSFIREIPMPRAIDANNNVSNPHSVLYDDDIERINTLLNQLEDSTGIQTAVVAIDSIGEGMTDRTLATAIFEAWGIGEKGKDNGLLILLIVDPDYRRITFETGYGLEGDLPDAICKRIQTQHMVPLLKDNLFSKAMVAGVEAVCTRLCPNISSISSGNDNDSANYSNTEYVGEPFSIPVSLCIIFGFVGLLWLCSWMLFRRSANKQRNTRRMFITLFVISSVLIYWITDSLLETERNLTTVLDSIATSIFILLFLIVFIPLALLGKGRGGRTGGGGGSYGGGGGSYGGGSSGGGGASSSF